MQSGRSSECQNREPSWINASSHRHEADALGHMRIDHAVDTLSRRHAVESEPFGDAVDGCFRRATIEARTATKEIVRVEKPEDEIGICHRGVAAAAAIARRARPGAGTLGPNMQHAAVVDTCNRPAPSTDAGDVEALQRHALASNAPVGRNGGLTADNERDIGRGAAHVERNEVTMAQQAGSVLAAGNAPGRPGEHTSRCQSHRLGNGSDPTMRLNDQDWRTQSRLTQPQFEARKVALQSRANIGVDHRRAEAVVLLDLGQDSRRERNICARHRRTHSLCACLLMDRIPPAVQIADRNGFNTLVLQARNGRSKRVAVQGNVDSAIWANSLAHTDPALARHELYWRWLTQMVAVVFEAFPHLDDVAMPLCGQKADLCALALDKRVGGNRSAVDNPLGASQHRGAVNCQGLCEAIEPFHHAHRLITWSRRNFGLRDAARSVDANEIREGAAHIDADPEHAQLFRVETNPRIASRARSSALRCSGSPQPPPPPEWALSTSPGRNTMPVSLVFSGRSGRPADCSQ